MDLLECIAVCLFCEAELEPDEITMCKRCNMQTTVINIRGIRCLPPNVAKIDRSTIFGNPFHIGKDGDREAVIDKYNEWFHLRLRDETFTAAVEALRGKVLGCWCKPLACHGDIISEYLNGEGELCAT